YYVVGAHQSYHGFEDTPRRRITKSASFTVDWDHPVFTGGRPVNLQLASFNNRCIQVDAQGRLAANTCDSQQSAQSFIYDQLGRYVSASNTKLCLDGEALDALQPCNQNLTQRWE
ncbi:RICIN domain-containing protein, partial [Klebsiella pneumoniae]